MEAVVLDGISKAGSEEKNPHVIHDTLSPVAKLREKYETEETFVNCIDQSWMFFSIASLLLEIWSTNCFHQIDIVASPAPGSEDHGEWKATGLLFVTLCVVCLDVWASA